MATLAVTNSFSAGTTIVAADMNENFDDVEAFINSTPGVLQLTGGTVTGATGFGVDGTGVDVTFHSDTAGDNMLWDASEEKLILEGTNGATVLDVTDGNVVIGDGTLTVGSDGAGEDVTFHSDTAGDAFVWDSSEEKLTITGTNGQTALAVADGNVTMADDLSVTGNVTIQSLDMDTIVEGDVIYGSGADTLARLARGSDDEVLTLASGVPSWAAASAGVSWSGSTANGLGTFGSSSSIVAESTATYDGTTLALTTSGGGLKMDGLNSSDANTLDDYEEGTWTAAIAAASGTITVHGTNKVGSYVKIGQIVHIQGAIGVSAISSPSGALSITGLPFTPHNGLTGDADRAFPNVYIAEPTAQTLGVFGRIVDGAATIEFRAGTGETSEDSSIADVIDTSSQFYIGGSYRAAT